MFPQVVLTEKDRKYHRLLWRDLDLTKPMDVYEVAHLTFGDRASPYLAQLVLGSYALDFKENYPEQLWSCSQICTWMITITQKKLSAEDAILVCEYLIKVLGGTGFRAQKWCSNCHHLWTVMESYVSVGD